MTISDRYSNNFISVKYFLSSYRALSDGRSGIHHLEQMLTSADYLFSEWKIVWIGTCATLRTAIDLFKLDSRSCIDEKIRTQIKVEWAEISGNKDAHSIFWEFLKKERDNIIHEYEWQAYETWLKPDGTYRPPEFSLLSLNQDGARPRLIMKAGHYQGRDSLELLKEAADWVEARIFAAIARAGFDPDEQRGLVHFQALPKTDAQNPLAALLGGTIRPSESRA